MSRERGGVVGTVLAGIGLAVVVVVLILFAVCGDDDDNKSDGSSLGRVVLVSHHYDDGDCYEYGDCGDDGYGGRDRYRQNYGNDRGDQSRCRGRGCRGSFSPGPFDRSPLDFRNACISLNCSGRDDNRDRRRDDQPPPDEPMAAQSLGCAVPVPWHCDPKPQSLFPPTPSGIRDFVTGTIKSGLDLGQQFANLTITFVESILLGVA